MPLLSCRRRYAFCHKETIVSHNVICVFASLHLNQLFRRTYYCRHYYCFWYKIENENRSFALTEVTFDILKSSREFVRGTTFQCVVQFLDKWARDEFNEPHERIYRVDRHHVFLSNKSNRSASARPIRQTTHDRTYDRTFFHAVPWIVIKRWVVPAGQPFRECRGI